MSQLLQQWLNTRQHTPCHRQLLVISGEYGWLQTQVISHFNPEQFKNALWVGKNKEYPHSINIKDYRTKLGQEYDLVVVDAFDGFRANAAMALSGTIKSGGLMVLLCPELDSWATYADPEHLNRISYGYYSEHFSSAFYQYLANTFINDPYVAILTNKQFIDPIAKLDAQQRTKTYQQQQLAVGAICKVANGHAHRPLTLSADRGRGKSSALGIAAAKLMQASTKNIIITAPHISTTEQVFEHAKRQLPDFVESKNQLSFESSTLSFIALDKLLESHAPVDILFIDEAAAIPIDILTKLTISYPRIVFSTTIHGYEGSGRGFEVRFKHRLAELKPSFKNLHLHEPIRWYLNDPLEQFWFKALCYNPLQQTQPIITTQALDFQQLSKKQLTQSPALLNKVCSLLIDAHYQTSPDDIQRLLDAPEAKCFIISQNQQVLAMAQINEEGGNKLSAIAQDICSGKRRVKGHLVAQNLANTYNDIAFCTFTQWRITRIAVHPSLQGNSLGSQLLSFIKHQAKLSKVYTLTSAFGCNSTLLNFWRRNEFQLLKLSNKVEVSSGENNCIVAHPLYKESENSIIAFEQGFIQELHYQADKAWQNISSDLLADIITTTHAASENELSAAQTQIIQQFCQGSRTLFSIQRLARQFLLSKSNELVQLPVKQRNLLIATLIQNKALQQLVEEFTLTGKKQIESAVRTAISSLLSEP